LSIELMNSVLRCDGLRESSHKFVLLLLANCANGEGFCYPSRGYIARLSMLSEDTVSRAITQLCSDGHLTENKRVGRNSTFVVHPKSPESESPESEPTPRTMRGVEKPDAQELAAALISAASSVAPDPAPRSSPALDPVQSGATKTAQPASKLSTNPPHHAAGACGKASGQSGQSIHNPPHEVLLPSAPCGDTPRTMRDETSEILQRNSEPAPDDLKNRLTKEPRKRSRPNFEPTAEELERSRVRQLQKIDQAMRAKGGPLEPGKWYMAGEAPAAVLP
jgi:hypothetical protein